MARATALAGVGAVAIAAAWAAARASEESFPLPPPALTSEPLGWVLSALLAIGATVAGAIRYRDALAGWVGAGKSESPVDGERAAAIAREAVTACEVRHRAGTEEAARVAASALATVAALEARVVALEAEQARQRRVVGGEEGVGGGLTGRIVALERSAPDLVRLADVMDALSARAVRGPGG